jgi:hypothetical protein
MGYEVRMMVVEKTGTEYETCRVGNQIRMVWREDGQFMQTQKYYFNDNNTKTMLPPETKTIKGNDCHIISMIDLCDTGECYCYIDSICKFEDSDGSIVYDPFNVNKMIGLDHYNDYRNFVPIKVVLKMLNKAVRKSKAKGEAPYRRFLVAIAMLRSIKKTFTNDKIGCLFYGH